MKKRKMQEKTIFTGNGQSTLITIAPNGQGQFNCIIEDDENVLLAASDLSSKKDCELTAALFLLIRNGHSADIYVHGAKRKSPTIVKANETKTESGEQRFRKIAELALAVCDDDDIESAKLIQQHINEVLQGNSVMNHYKTTGQ